MRHTKLVLTILACGILGTTAQAQAQKKHAPKATAAQPTGTGAIKKLSSVEGITEYELPNGLRVLLFPDQSKPTITVNITYLVGSRLEGYGESGMAHLLEHMVFKGSTKHRNIPAELSSHGASPNGTTSDDRTNYFETFNATDENLNWALDLESDRMVNSFIKNEDLQSEFTVVRNEFERGENNPARILNERIMSTAFLWHNYGKSTIGSKEDIEKVPIKNLQAFYHKYYQPDNAVLMVTGKIDEQKTLALIQKYFGPIPRPTRVLQPDYTVEPVQDGERSVTLRRVGDVQAVACAYHICAGSDPDYAPLDVLTEVLSNEPEGRLYKALVKTGKASSAYAYVEGKHDPGVIYFNADVLKEKSLDSARTALYATINDLIKNPPTEAEVSRAKTKLLSDFDNVFRKSNITGLVMSEFIAQGDWRLAFIYRDNLKKVTPADVARVAAHYLKVSNRTTGLFIPTDKPDRAEIPARPDVAKLVDNYKGGEAMAAGEAFDATPTNIDKRTEAFKLTSGAQVALLDKSTRGHVVEARFTLRLGDEGSMMNKKAIADVTADMLMRGTQKHSRAQINDMLDKLSSKLNISGSGQNVNISITSTKENLPAVLDLLNEILHEPAFPQDEFKTLLDENLAGIESQRSQPQAIASQALNRTLHNFPKGHILETMTFDEMAAAYKAVSLDDIRKFHTDYYNGSSATGSIVGDFDKEALKPILNKIFDNWNAVKSFSRVPTPYHEVPVGDMEFKTPDKKMAIFFAAQPLQLRDSDPDYPALMMANYILGGGFLNSRLATRIRQKEGISYGVGSQLSVPALDDDAVLVAYAIYNPDNKEKLVAAWRDEMNRIVSGGITAEELKDAKSGLLQSRATSRANDAGLAAALSSDLYLGRTMAFSQKLDDKIGDLSVEQVNTAIKKYFNPEKAILVKAGDFK